MQKNFYKPIDKDSFSCYIESVVGLQSIQQEIKIMKKIRAIFIACLLFFSVFFTAGCYITQAQPMKNVKGTYELTNYTITEKKKHSDGVVRETTTDMLETRGMVTYLVITGTGTGYYVYKSNDVAAYAREAKNK